MRRYILIIMAFVLLYGCGKKENPPAPAPDLSPLKAVLLFPAQNAACTEGRSVSATESAIRFDWDDAANTESYELSLKNLTTGNVTLHSAIKSELEITLPLSMPFSWFVTSKSSKSSSSAKSESWNFYNAGPGVSSYVPFPAELLIPAKGQNVGPSAAKVTLDWTGSDADNDIESYTVYFGLSITPPLFKSGLTESALPDVPVSVNNTYYWKVVTKDVKGNTSNSEIFQFKTY